MPLRETLQTIVEGNLESLNEILQDDELHAALYEIATCVIKTLQTGGKVLLCGNGGSAADAQHIAAEFIGRFKLERKAFSAIALTTDTSILTCISNDYSYDDVFVRQLEGLGREGDVLIGLSTSGNSENVVRAVKRASDMKIKTITFTGNDGGKLKGLSDCNYNVSSSDTPCIQAGHGIALHALCEVVEKELAI